MKRSIRIFAIAVLLATAPTLQGHAQIIDVVKQAIIAAIKAADIAVQKAQNATIDLQNAQKAVENELSKVNLGEIGDWEGKFKDLYAEYFQELWKVKTAISYFQEITGIISQQSQLVGEYKQAYNLIQQDKNFTPAELSYIYTVYSGIISESVKSLDEIVTLLTSFSLQMSDAARLRIIQQASADIQRETSDLRNFNNQTIQISLQRAKTVNDLNTVRRLYGLSN